MAKLGRPVLAVMVMAVIIAVLFVLCTPRTASRSSAPDSGRSSALPSPGTSPGTSPGAPVRVLVLDFNPVVADSAGRRMHQAFGWAEPRALADE